MDTGFSTKSLGTFFGFRGSLITMVDGVPVDFAITSETDIDDRDVLSVLSQGGRYPMMETKDTFRSNFIGSYWKPKTPVC